MDTKNTSFPYQRRGTFFGIKVVRAAFVLAFFGWGVGFYGPPIFLHAVISRTGWSLALVSAAVTFHFLFGAAVVALLPRLYREFGIPQTTITGAACLALGVVGWSLARSPIELFGSAALTGGGWVTMGAAAINAIVSPWYVQGRPLALAKAYNGASVGGMVFSSLLVAMIASLGFTTTACTVGTVMLCTVILIAKKRLSSAPERCQQLVHADCTPTRIAILQPHFHPLAGRSVWKNRQFLTLAGAMALSLFAQIGLLAHLFGLLVRPLGLQVAGAAMTIATASAIVGRTVVGRLMPNSADRRLIAAASYGVQLAASLLLLVGGTESGSVIFIAVVLFGLGIGNATSLPPLVAQTEFANDDAIRVVSLIIAISQALYAFAPAAFGIVLALSATSQASESDSRYFFASIAFTQFLALSVMLSGRRRIR